MALDKKREKYKRNNSSISLKKSAIFFVAFFVFISFLTVILVVRAENEEDIVNKIKLIVGACAGIAGSFTTFILLVNTFIRIIKEKTK